MLHLLSHVEVLTADVLFAVFTASVTGNMNSIILLCVFSTSIFINLISGIIVTQLPPTVTTNEGMMGSLSCSSDAAADYMFWYIQKPGQTIQYLFQGYTKQEDLDKDMKGRFFYKTDSTNKQFPLNITELRVSDSGTYYCAMRPTLGEEHKEYVQ
ncbi:TCR alpha V3 [Pelobates cultripes]|nr:TCR alpha V3 [Pelobates cultripes]